MSTSLGPRDVADATWAADGRGVYFTYDDRGVRKLGYTTLDGKVRTLAEGLGGTDLGRPYTSGGFSVARNGRAAFAHNTPERPADVAVTAAGGARVLTALNDDLLGAKTLGKVRELTWKSSKDQREVQGWVITPPDFDASKKYPLILEIHGGPHAMYGHGMFHEMQVMASRGYGVLFCNPRGSAGYGEAFNSTTRGIWGESDMPDVMAASGARLNVRRA